MSPPADIGDEEDEGVGEVMAIPVFEADEIALSGMPVWDAMLLALAEDVDEKDRETVVEALEDMDEALGIAVDVVGALAP